jgi:hypothetical protein
MRLILALLGLESSLITVRMPQSTWQGCVHGRTLAIEIDPGSDCTFTSGEVTETSVCFSDDIADLSTTDCFSVLEMQTAHGSDTH